MAENDQKDKIVEKVTGEVENTDKKENNEDRYEKVCFICHRPESVTGKMIDQIGRASCRERVSSTV